jgi:hypothetical protein
MTFAQLYNAVITRTGRTDKTQLAKDSINLWLGEIINRHPWKALFVTTDLTININDLQTQLPANFFKLIEVRVVNPAAYALSYPMLVLFKNDFIKRWPNVSAFGSGRPFAGYEENGILYYSPKASQVYTLRLTYMAKPVTLADDGDPNPIPTIDAALISFATAEVFDSVQMFEAGQQWRAKAEASLEQAYMNDNRTPVVSPKLQERQHSALSDGSPEPWNDPFAGHD